MNIKQPKAIEASVCSNLNKLDDSWIVTEYEYSHFDLHTTKPLNDGSFALCEVKSRAKKYFDRGTLIIEVEKINWLLEEQAKAEANGKELKLFLCCTEGRSLKAKQYLYNVNDILMTANKIELMANRQTYGDKTKVLKEFFEFNVDIFTLELTEQKLGDNYEN